MREIENSERKEPKRERESKTDREISGSEKGKEPTEREAKRDPVDRISVER